METDANRRIHHSNPPPTTHTTTTCIRLFNDGIVLIYSFLTFTELLTACRIAHQWYQIIQNHISTVASGKRSPLVRYTYQVDLSRVEGYPQFVSMLQSPANPLITTIPRSNFGARIVDLQQIANVLPQLSELALDVSIPERGLPHESLILTHETMVEFPQHLISLTIHMTYPATHGGIKVTYPHKSFFRHLFSTICEQLVTLQKLVWIPQSEVNITGLLNLPHLMDLEDSFSHEKRDFISILALKHWKLPYRMAPHGIRFDWNLFHRESTLMKNLKEWTIMNAAFTPDDYRSLATNATALTSLKLHPESQTHFEGFRHLADSNLEHLKLYSILDPCSELIHLIKIRSLTFVRASILEVDSWLNLFSHLTCLEEIDFSWSIIPTQLVAVLPHKTTIRHITVAQAWVKGLVTCQRLQELSLVDITGTYSCEQLKNDLREICNSSANSLRWVEVRNWTETSPGTGQSIKSTFLLDSSKSMTQLCNPSNDTPCGPGVETVANAPPIKDLTRYGIEPHPGPTNSEIINISETTVFSATNVTRERDVENSTRSLVSTSASQIFRDGLLLIYSYLSFRELIQAGQTSHRWYQPISKSFANSSTNSSSLMRCTYEPDLSTLGRYHQFLGMLQSSAARALITSIPQSRAGARIVDLQQITDSLPRLTELTLDAAVQQRGLPRDSLVLTHETPIIFPVQLLSLTIHASIPLLGLNVVHPQPSFWQHLFNAICDQARQLEKLVWTVLEGNHAFGGYEPILDLSPLLQLTNLTDFEGSFNYSYGGHEYAIISQLPLKRWVTRYMSQLNWREFRSASRLLQHLEEWSLKQVQLTQKNFITLASNATSLTRLSLEGTKTRGLGHCVQLRSLRLEDVEIPLELGQLILLHSLTLVAVKIDEEVDMNIFSTLSLLQDIEFIRCILPIGIISALPKRATVRKTPLSSQLIHELSHCHRLQELSLIDCTHDTAPSLSQLRQALSNLCASTTCSLRRVEVRNLRIGFGDSTKHTFILDSSKPFFQPSSGNSLIDSKQFGEPSPAKDLTRFGIEPHPGPIDHDKSNRTQTNITFIGSHTSEANVTPMELPEIFSP